MLRATSEIAAAISVTSEPLNPSVIASSRPLWRAVTMSIVEWTSTLTLPLMFDASCIDPRYVIQKVQAFLEVQGGAHSFQGKSQLHHGKRHFGLDAYDHGIGATQIQHVRHRA